MGGRADSSPRALSLGACINAQSFDCRLRWGGWVTDFLSFLAKLSGKSPVLSFSVTLSVRHSMAELASSGAVR
jgi:hypothetical protein